MGILGRRAVAIALTGALPLTVSRGALADEVIQDPELAPSKPVPAAPPGEQVIDDPELSSGKSPGVAKTAPPQTEPPGNPEGKGETTFRVILHSRFGMDTQWDRAAQDILEETTIGLVEAQYRKSESLLFSVGLRARHALGMRHDGGTRHEIDAVPVSAYVDGAIGRSVHLRGGYQTIAMGRFDLFSAANFLGVYDLRSGPVTMPDAADVAQPALRLDWDPTTDFTLQAYYVPFFTPDILPVYGTNYALLERSLGALSRTSPGVVPGAQDLERLLGRAGVGRSGLVTGSSQAIRALAPAPDFTTPQGAIRATERGGAGEASLTVGTALERLPAIRFLPAVAPTEARLEYGRFYVASLDGALDAGPFQLGAEVAIQGHRTLSTVPRNPPLPPSAAVPEPGHTSLLHLGLRAELVDQSGWLAEVEVFGQYALSPPDDPAMQWFMMEQGRYLRGVAAGVHFAPEDAPLRLELGGVVFSGPTLVLMPRAQYAVATGFFLEAGAVFVEGPVPGASSPMVSLGGIFDDVDQVFVGARWVL